MEYSSREADQEREVIGHFRQLLATCTFGYSVFSHPWMKPQKYVTKNKNLSQEDSQKGETHQYFGISTRYWETKLHYTFSVVETQHWPFSLTFQQLIVFTQIVK